jgi:uncharacterized membrane-anchored protein YitT (DUF2179 family)
MRDGFEHKDEGRAGVPPKASANGRERHFPLGPFSPEEIEAKRHLWVARTRDALPSLARAYSAIAVGCLVMAAGYSFFMIPQRIAPGGVFGIATILHYASGSLFGRTLPTGTIALVLNIPLFLWGLKALGARFVARTVFGMVAASLFMDLLSFLIPQIGWQEAVHGLDPMLASLFGGLAIGGGLGIVFRHMGSTGGSDIVGQILGRRTDISVGAWMIITDAIVVLFASYYFKNLNLSLYAVVTIFVTGRVIDGVLEGRTHSRAVTIVTEKGEAIREAILFGIGRSGTAFEGHGLYSGRRKDMILCVVNRKQLVPLEQLVAKADPEAFLVVGKAHEVLGEGFRPLREDVGAVEGV